MSEISPDTLKDLFVAVLQDNPNFEYISGDQPFIIRYKEQQYYVYIIKLTSAYFKSRPDTTRAQLNRRSCFDDIKKSPNPFLFLGYDGENDVLVCWNNKVAKARLNEKSTVSFYSRKIYQDQIVLGEPRHFKLKNGDQPYFFKRKDLPLFLDRIDTLFPDTLETAIAANEPVEAKAAPASKSSAQSHLYDPELLCLLRPMLTGPAKRTLEAAQTIMRYLQDKYEIHISMRECMGLLKNLHFDMVEGYGIHPEDVQMVADETKTEYGTKQD